MLQNAVHENSFLGELIREIRIVNPSNIPSIDPDPGTAGRIDASSDVFPGLGGAEDEVRGSVRGAGRQNRNIRLEVYRSGPDVSE